jgi:hypothetical protein
VKVAIREILACHGDRERCAIGKCCDDVSVSANNQIRMNAELIYTGDKAKVVTTLEMGNTFCLLNLHPERWRPLVWANS